MLTVTNPVVVQDPSTPFDSAVFGLEIVPRIVNGQVQPIVKLHLRRGRKKDGNWELWGDDVIHLWPSVEALAADLPEEQRPAVLQVWDTLEALVQTLISQKQLL